MFNVGRFTRARWTIWNIFNSVISDFDKYVSTDCDAELLQYVLKDFSNKLLSNINQISRA